MEEDDDMLESLGDNPTKTVAQKPTFFEWLGQSARDAVLGTGMSRKTKDALLLTSWCGFHLLLLLISISCSSTVGSEHHVAFTEWNLFWRIVSWLILIVVFVHIHAYAYLAENALKSNECLNRAQIFRIAYFAIPNVWLLVFSIVLGVSYIPELCAITIIMLLAGVVSTTIYFRSTENAQVFQLAEDLEQ